MIRRVPPAVGLVVGLATLLALAGCTSGDGGGLARDYKGVQGSGYVSGDGSVLTIAPDHRTAAPDWSAMDTSGATLSSDDLRGQVQVINFWYAGCGPCRAEAPTLKDLAGELTPKGVEFLGVNTRDTASIAASFSEKYGLDYPTVLDDGENAVQLSFAGSSPPSAVPTTLVLDEKGRVAARFNGEIDSPSVLLDIVRDVRAGR